MLGIPRYDQFRGGEMRERRMCGRGNAGEDASQDRWAFVLLFLQPEGAGVWASYTLLVKGLRSLYHRGMAFLVEGKTKRLDLFLTERTGVRSRTAWQKAIERGAVTINKVTIKKSGVRVHAGDKVEVLQETLLVREEERILEPEPEIPLKVAYEDDDMLVINKPAGILVHPTPLHHKGTIVNALLARYPEIRTVGENPLRPGIVHRLDKDTSGLLAVAKTQHAFEWLKRQFMDREVKKTYLALVEGVPEKREGIIDYPIRPSTQNPLRKVAMRGKTPIGDASIRAAVTHYNVLEEFGERYALVELKPETGRTHQLRVHMKALGHPIVGDMLYHRPRINADITLTNAEILVPRQFLHAAKLELIAPSGKPITLVAELPEDLKKVLETLRAR